MYISDMKLDNFRNYHSQQLEFSKGINIFVGDNAQGKTNLLEAVYYCSRGESFKSVRDSDVIRLGAESSELYAQIIRENRRKLIHIRMEKSEKRISINGLKLDAIKEMKNQFDIVYFWPEHLRVVKEGPVHRRELMDEAIVSIKPSYKQLLSRYMVLLAQRNKLIKMSRNIRYFTEQLNAVTRQLSEHGSAISVIRSRYVSILKEEMERVHFSFTGGKETVEVGYEHSLIGTGTDGEDYKFSAEELYALMMSKREEDLQRGFTTVGPHRDDLILRLDGKNAKQFASQGQQRSVVLSLKLSELNIIKQYNRSEPILLLDDVFSELDIHRREHFLESIRGFQALITTNDMDRIGVHSLGTEHRIYKIVAGRIE